MAPPPVTALSIFQLGKGRWQIHTGPFEDLTTNWTLKHTSVPHLQRPRSRFAHSPARLPLIQRLCPPSGPESLARAGPGGPAVLGRLGARIGRARPSHELTAGQLPHLAPHHCEARHKRAGMPASWALPAAASILPETGTCTASGRLAEPLPSAYKVMRAAHHGDYGLRVGRRVFHLDGAAAAAGVVASDGIVHDRQPEAGDDPPGGVREGYR